MSLPAALMQLARQYGVQTSYTNAAGQEQEAGADALLMVLKSLGAPIERADQAEALLAERDDRNAIIEPVLVAWEGALTEFSLRSVERTDAALRYHIQLEQGETRSGELVASRTPDGVTVSLPDRLPFGYHDLTVETQQGAAHALIISAPTRAYAQPSHHGEILDPRSPILDPRSRPASPKQWGVFLPVYALRAEGMQGIGDFTALGALSSWAGELGASYVGTLPLLATFLDQPFEASPYSPVSRLFWNETFVDVHAALARVPSTSAATVINSPGFTQETARLNAGELVDHRAVARLERLALQPMADFFFEQDRAQEPDFQSFLGDYPRVQDYAQFRAACERQQKGWPVWPERMRAGELHPDDYDAATVDYHVFVQYMAALQLRAVSQNQKARLYLDLPLGVHPDGYDVWRERALFATGVSAGAPPDAFFTKGQSWGFPPMSPTAMRADGYAYMREAVRAHLRYAGALRLDHVMALHRLFWVPNEMEASAGVYVRYHAEELYALLCLESSRHQALIIGEDLGTVPPEVREGMDRHNLARMFVVQFELRADHAEPLPAPPQHSVVSLNTHDMPSFEGFRRGLDADLRGELGLIERAEIEEIRHHRRELIQQVAQQLARAGFLHGRPEPETLRDALLAFLAASDARLLLVNLEDLWREERPQNVPGTSAERPNWRRRTRPTLEEIMNAPDINAVLNRINQIRRER